MENQETAYPIKINTAQSVGVPSIVFLSLLSVGAIFLGIFVMLTYHEFQASTCILAIGLIGGFFIIKAIANFKSIFVYETYIQVDYNFTKGKNYKKEFSDIYGFIFCQDSHLGGGKYKGLVRTIILKFTDGKILFIRTDFDKDMIDRILSLLRNKNIKDYSVPNQTGRPLFSWKEITSQFGN